MCLSALFGAAQLANAQTPSASPPTRSTSLGEPDDPNPYYVGVGEALTHDSNVYRVPGGRGDNYSSTSVRAGFSQPFSRQRVFGAASASLNRYQDASPLNNTSYALNAGANGETVWHLSGDLNASMARHLSAPTASAAGLAAVRNVADTRNVDAAARWGGVSLLTLEANAGWSSVDYSGVGSDAGDSRQSRAGLSLNVSPGGPLTLGLAGRLNRTQSPHAVVDAQGLLQSNTVESRSLDILVGYNVSGFVTTSGRVSYTKQTSSGIAAQKFSGLTGGLSVNWRPTSKTALHADASRDAGAGAGVFGNARPALLGSGGAAPGAPTPLSATTPTGALYENNRVTDSIAVGAMHATTAKIAISANARYARARIVAGTGLTTAGSSTANTTDTSKLVSIGATYAINRAWNLGCDLSSEWRDVGGGISFAYRATTATCSTQLTLR